jgi:hypothetical protein
MPNFPQITFEHKKEKPEKIFSDLFNFKVETINFFIFMSRSSTRRISKNEKKKGYEISVLMKNNWWKI